MNPSIEPIQTTDRPLPADAQCWLSPAAMHALLERAPDGIFVADIEGRYTYVNAAGCEMLGFRRDEIVGRKISDFLRREDVPRLMRSKAVMLEGRSDPGEWMLRRKDGSWLAVEVHGNILPDGQWQGFARDISARVAQEAERTALFEQAERDRKWLRAVMDQMPLGVVIFEVGGRITFNQRAEKMLGMTLAPDRGGEQYAARIYRPDGSRVSVDELPSIRVLREGVSVYAEEYVVRRPDGTDCPVLASAAPIQDGRGRLVAAVGVFQDMSERMGLERAIRDNERLLKTAFELLPVGVWLTDAAGNIVWGNPAGKRIWGGNPPPGPDRYAHYEGWWVDTGQPIAAEEWALARAIGRGETTRREMIRIKCFDGSFKTIINWATPIRGDAGEITGAVAVNEDVTVLHQTQEQLRTAVRDREHILAVVAHDLRSPLNAIGLSAEVLRQLLQSNAPAERLDATATRIARATEAMGGLVDDLLAISASRPGRSMIDFVPVSPAQVIAQAAEAARPLIARAGLDLVVLPMDELPDVYMDVNRILRVFANLFDNALKFTERGGRIMMRAEPSQGAVKFCIGNSGPPLREQEREHLFQPFWQAGREDRRGAGLGLSICRSILEAHGGTIWTEPANGMRVKICFVLPCVRPALAAGVAPP